MKDRLTVWAVILLLSPAPLVYFLSDSPSYSYYSDDVGGVIISFKRVTERRSLCDEEELEEFKKEAKLRRPHMQRADRVCGSRERVPLRLKVWIDGETALDKQIVPSGIRQDSATYVYEKFILPLGSHAIKVAIKDTRDGDETFGHSFEGTVTLESRDKVVIGFDSVSERFSKS
ncbi:MAG: hypothetical protein ACNS63_07495 [Candidatus Nitrospinota bacterium M3_3B_026]